MQVVQADNLQGVLAVLDEDPFVLCRPADRRLEPPLVVAVRRGCSLQLLVALLKHGADPNACDPQGMTALDALAQLRPKPSLHVHTMQGWTVAPWEGAFPASWDNFAPQTVTTTERQRCAYGALLLAFGADARRQGRNGLTAIELAEEQGQARLAHLLQHWAGSELRAVRRASSLLAGRIAPLCGGGGVAKCTQMGRAAVQLPLRTSTEAQSGVQQVGLMDLPDPALGCLCEMLAPMSL
jgi:hypothetical protein